MKAELLLRLYWYLHFLQPEINRENWWLSEINEPTHKSTASEWHIYACADKYWSKSVIFCINIFCNNRKLYAVGHAFRQLVSFFKQNDLHTHLSKCRWIIQKTINLIINTCVIQTWVVVKSSSTPGINGSIFQWVSWPRTPMIFPVIKNKKRATDSVWIFKVVLSLLSSINNWLTVFLTECGAIKQTFADEEIRIKRNVQYTRGKLYIFLIPWMRIFLRECNLASWDILNW